MTKADGQVYAVHNLTKYLIDFNSTTGIMTFNKTTTDISLDGAFLEILFERSYARTWQIKKLEWKCWENKTAPCSSDFAEEVPDYEPRDETFNATTYMRLNFNYPSCKISRG